MAEGVYKIVEVVGVSEKSWEDAGRNAVETAAGSLRDLRVAEVTKLDMKVENGKVGRRGPAPAMSRRCPVSAAADVRPWAARSPTPPARPAANRRSGDRRSRRVPD
jgi:flavin-binding protein dodecin